MVLRILIKGCFQLVWFGFVAMSATHYFFGAQQQPVCSHGEAVDDAARLLLQLRLLDVAHHPTCNLAYER